MKPNLTDGLFIGRLPRKKWKTAIISLLLPFLGLSHLFAQIRNIGCLSHSFSIEARLHFNTLEYGIAAIKIQTVKNPRSMII